MARRRSIASILRQEGDSARSPALDHAKGRGEGCSGNPEPLVLDDAEGRGESRSYEKMVFGSPELSVFDDVGVAVKTASSIPSPWFSMMQKVAAKAAPTKRWFL
jgi:hypothetical protein